MNQIVNRKKRFKIRKNSEFRVVYRRGKSYSDHLLVLYVKRNGNNINRVGISVSKKVGKSVVRSRVKRLIRESYRINSDNLKQGYDLVFIARTRAKDRRYFEIEKSVIRLIKKAGLIDEKDFN